VAADESRERRHGPPQAERSQFAEQGYILIQGGLAAAEMASLDEGLLHIYLLRSILYG
jgi:hypothetical protein